MRAALFQRVSLVGDHVLVPRHGRAVEGVPAWRVRETELDVDRTGRVLVLAGPLGPLPQPLSLGLVPDVLVHEDAEPVGRNRPWRSQSPLASHLCPRLQLALHLGCELHPGRLGGLLGLDEVLAVEAARRWVAPSEPAW